MKTKRNNRKRASLHILRLSDADYNTTILTTFKDTETKKPEIFRREVKIAC